MKRPTDTGAKFAFGAERERFQKWERSLERELTASDLDCLWARKVAMLLDIGGLTLLPINHFCRLL